jgi:hypothetical protein
MTTQQKTTETTGGDHAEDTGRPLRDHPLKRLASTGNVVTAVAALGASIALGSVMALPVYKFLAGLALVALVVGLAGMAYGRYVHAEPTVEETPVEVESQS